MDIAIAKIEAERCLGCYDAPCQRMCPVKIPIPRFVRAIAEDNIEGAAALIREENPLGHTCGLVCPSASFCQSRCTLTKMGQSALRIRDLQAFATKESSLAEEYPPVSGGTKVAVIGAGPAGLSCAHFLRKEGCAVDLFEKEAVPGGTPEALFHEDRLPKGTIRDEMAGLLTAEGIRLLAEREVDSGRLQELCKEYSAVCMATGRQEWRRDDSIRGATPGKGTVDPTAFLKSREPSLEKTDALIISGSGVVSLKAAVKAKTEGVRRVRIISEKGPGDIRLWKPDFVEAVNLGVEFLWNSRIEEIHVEDGAISGVTVKDGTNGDRLRMNCGACLPLYHREKTDAPDFGKVENLFFAGEALTKESNVTAAVLSGKTTAGKIAGFMKGRESEK